MSETTELVKFDASENIVIKNTDDYVIVCNLRKAASAYIKAAHEKYDGDISVAHNHHESLVAKLREIITPPETWMSKADRRINDFNAEQERIRLETERKAQEAARKAEEDRKLAEAVALEQSGDEKAADQVMAEPVYIPPVVVARTVPKVQGVSFVERWTFRVVDADKIPRSYLVPDTVKIGQVVRALKAASNIPGVEAYSEKSVSGRG